MSASPITNGGLLLRKLRLPDLRDYTVDVPKHAAAKFGNMENFAKFLRDIIAKNPDQFHVFRSDETQSNKFSIIHDSSKKVWMVDYLEEDEDGGNLAFSGRVMEILSEHAVEGWLEGYILSGRHGLFNSYKPFIHVIDSIVNQHYKRLEKCLEVEWRVIVPSLNVLLTATVWRQDPNGFTHQDPGFLDVVANKSPEVGVGIWPWVSNDQGDEPDVVMVSCGDVVTAEALAAVALLREYLPGLKIRFVNVVDLFKFIPKGDHPHGLSDREFKAIYMDDRPVIFNLYSYPWLVTLPFRRKGQHDLHVRDYKEKGNIDTPLELAIQNGIDRFSLAIDAIDRVPGLVIGARRRGMF
ncbi:hypothetical protein N0V90_002216 [Kalmusia sp. IMI 367209]|nr:hypothetical protein N0V90_002216 [Kalmusia sp. IMI 367209]